MARKTKEEAQRTREHIIDAARLVFHRHGVSRATLEQVAQEAGLTRGAVYWHFKDKVELFAAMREDVFVPLRERINPILFSDSYADPLDAIEASLKEVLRVLEDCPDLRQVFEVMVLRCEYVGEFEGVRYEADKPASDFRQKIEQVYRKAYAKGTLRAGLDPATTALDTWAFFNGLLHIVLGNKLESDLRAQVATMISTHMALRRRS